MSNVPSLQPLASNREALLLAEVAALLHDMGKCADEFIIKQASDKPTDYDYDPKKDQLRLLPPDLPNVTLLGETVPLRDLIEKGMPRIIRDPSRPWPMRVLGRCHSVAHVEKELRDSDTSTKQPKDDTRLSNAYGMEGAAVKGLTSLLHGLPLSSLWNRAVFVPRMQQAFDAALGDTRRPVNEVTLADWSGAVAHLYKSALAGALLGVKPEPDDLHWRLLRVNFDALGLYAKAIKVADLLAYQRAAEEACERVKRLVEEEYPLGNEVYRDSTGIYFTFPDIDLPADLAQEIRRRVEEVEPELAPRIAATQGTGANATEQLKGILGKARREARQALERPFDSQNLSIEWQELWASVPATEKWEACPVCRLRPMPEGREACQHCEERRGSRIADWQNQPQRTIWMDELADANGRVALVVGKFGLENWLSGDLVQTMLVNADPASNSFTPKNPSAARLRRVWETCHHFWAETVQSILDALPVRERWLLRGQGTKDQPPQGVVCDGTLNGQPITLWRLNDDLLTVSFVPEVPKTGQLNLSWEHEGRKGQGSFQVSDRKKPPADYSRYHPTLTLLSSPDQFLALVPAADALEIAHRIHTEYTKQFGKVQNRLPLFLGLVFFPRKIPLLAVMDTARQMLEVGFEEEQWEIAEDVSNGLVKFKNNVEWAMPTLMGDGTTQDEWYPFFFVKAIDPAYHTRRFQLRKEGNSNPQQVGSVSLKYADRWLVHVNDLKKNDVVLVTPSRFTYLWLEHTAKRFEFDAEKGVLLWEELPRLMKMWKGICQTPEMTDTRLRGVQALLATKAAAWEEDSDLKNLARTTLKRAGMLHAVTPDDVISGRFSRCLELHLKILKQKAKEGRHGLPS